MGLEIRRTHDKDLYLAENRYEQPKEISKRLAALVEEAGLHRPGTVVADFGCAAGEFLFFLRRLWPEVELLGFDVVPELIVKARARVPSVTFREGSVLDTAILPKSSMDVAFLSGVHSIFDDFEPCFSNLIEWTRPGGRVYVFGMFNPFPVDVWGP
jgi:trans-aconitate methyltransferase